MYMYVYYLGNISSRPLYAELSRNKLLFMSVKQHVSQCNSVADVFLIVLEHNGALWHRELRYISFGYLSVESIHCRFWAFHGIC